MPFEGSADTDENVVIGPVLKLLSGFPFKSEQFTSDTVDGVPLIRIRDLGGDITTCRYIGEFDGAYIVREGDILVSMDGDFLAVRWAGADALLNQRVLRVSSGGPARLDESYLFYRLQPDLARLEQAITGTTVKHLSTKNIKGLRWNLPRLDEQRRIAEVLRSIDEATSAQRLVLNQLQSAFDRLTQAFFSQNAYRPLVPLGNACESIQVGIVVRPASYYVQAGGVPALRSLNVGENRLDLADLVYISEDGHRLNRKSGLKAGDVVTRRTGEPGRTAVVPDGFDGGLNCIDIIFSRPKHELRPHFLSFFMNSEVAKRQVAGLQGGLAQQHLNVGEMKKMLVPVPPLNDQDEVVMTLQNAWGHLEAERKVFSRLSALKVVAASDLLSGRVRVPA